MITKIIFLTVLTLANLFLLGISAFYLKKGGSTSSRVGFIFMAAVAAANIIFEVGGVLL